MFSLEDTFGCVFSQLELDASAQIGDHDIIHARVRGPLPRSSREAKIVPQEDVGNDHFHRVIGKEAPWAYNLGMAKVQVILASGGKLYRQALVITLSFGYQRGAYGANYSRRVVFGYCTGASPQTCPRLEPAQDRHQSRSLPSGYGLPWGE
jgi:hypothetical protein